MLRDAIVGLGFEADFDPARNFAISLAKELDLHVLGTAFALVPVYPATTPMEIFGVDYVNAYRRENEVAAKRVIDHYARAAKDLGVVKSATRVVQSPVAEAGREFAKIARHFDLAILNQPKPKEWEGELIVETTLFESGRPIVAVPYIYSGSVKLNHITVCWDGSRAAARAIADAMPLLQRSRNVDILTVRTDGDGDFSAADIEGHLARHGISAAGLSIRSEMGEEGNTILNHAADAGTNLIVMGGYGHNRFREFILGGVTRVLLQSMTAPVLMSH
jgi:nucleotide-binding universal stress UspA family protein